MAQGDTTIRTDFEVGGASAAKMTVQDVYKSQSEAMKKASNEEISASRKAMAAKRLAAQKSRELTKIALAEERKAETLKAQQEASAVSLQRQRSTALIKIHNDEQAAIRKARAETARDAKRFAQQQERDAKNAAKAEAGRKKAGDKLLERGMWGAIMGVAGYAGVSGLQSILSGVTEGVQKLISKRQELEDAITPIVMLEDNVSRMGSIREEVSRTATSLGRSYQEVGQFYSDLVGSTGNLGASERESLIKETKELAQLTGGSLVTAQNLLTKSYQIFGKEVGNVNQLQNKLMVTQDQGSITFEDMALRLPELLQAGKSVGMNIDDILGSVIGATRQSGSIEKTMTGMRNFFLIINDAEEKGINLTGSYVQKLAQLDEMFTTNRKGMEDLFGREVVVHASGIAGAFRDVAAAIKDVGDVSENTDVVFDKLLKKFSDPQFRQMSAFKTYADIQENAANLSGGLGIADTPLLKTLEAGHAGAAHAALATGGVLPTWMTAPVGYAGAALLPGYAQEGGDMAMNTMEMPQFIGEKRAEFFRKKAADQYALDHFQYGGPETDRYKAMAQSVSSRQLSPHLMTEEERRIYKETGKAPQSAEVSVATSASQERHINALDRNTEALLATQTGSNSVAKPGGSKVNSEETL